MPVLRERVAWSRPRKPRGPELTPDEAAHVKAAIAFLRVRLGGWRALAEAAGLKTATVQYAAKPKGGVSAGVALRVARAAHVPMESLLSGAFPPPGMCAVCGHVRAEGDR